MKAQQWKVLLVEDDPRRSAHIQEALKKALKPIYQLEPFDPKDGDDVGPYEDRLRRVLQSPHFKNLAIVVTDRDLSALKSYRGLSEATVSKVAVELSIPVCVYAAGKDASLLERHRSGGGGRVLLSSADTNAMARKVRVLANGFRNLRDVVSQISRSKKMRERYHGPATVLADLLKAHEIVDQLSLYTRGDQRMLAGVTPTDPTKAGAGRSAEDVRSVAMALGVWLYESILRFPGVVLDLTSAASFLGIEPASMKEAPIQKVFAEALYEGPFADSEEPRWWRHRLTELLKTNDFSDGEGAEVVKKKTGKAPRRCRCSVDGKAPAGFFCVMTEQPVCEKHSVGQVSWLPRGADLARVRKELYDQIGPWVGMS